MEHFAHIFIGKEFAEIVSNIGRHIYKYGGEEILSSVNLFVVDDMSVRQLLYPEGTVDIKDMIQHNSLQIEWREIGRLTDNPEDDKDLFLNGIFNQILRVDNAGANASLYTMIHFPLYKSDALESAEYLYRIIKLAGRPVDIDFMGYCDDMAPVIEPGYVIASPSRNLVEKYKTFRDAESIGYSTHFIVMQNASQNGISLGLNADSFATILSHFSILCAGYYHDIFPNTVEYMDAVAFGFSTLCLDRYLYAEYLLNKSMLNAMDAAHVNDREVDVNNAYVIVNNMLKDKATLLSTLFSQLDGHHNTEADDEYQEIQKKFTDEVQQIVDRCKDTLSRQGAITMQAAILAVCLAKTDCELFSETIFTQDIVTADKLFDEPIEYYINNDHAHYYKLDGENPVNPIQKLKELDTRLINSETAIRNLKNDLETLNKQIGDSEKVREFYVEGGYVHFENQKFRLLPSVEEEPLTETYTPHEVKVRSLDMRSKFTSVKNQGQQGSCLSFALTSIFEYVMSLNTAQEFDLSEAFLYYNARELDGNGHANNDYGSRFKPSIDALIKYGIALEKVWPYNDQVYNNKPSEDAYADAAGRKLISAMNVNPKVSDIKSALVDNCPVAASFTLTKTFIEYGRSGGYIPMPNDEEVASEIDPDSKTGLYSCHAMVIVGFSDDLQMFIVRNSWGTDWGDNGYCYIPYSYVEHKGLLNYACILTEIENLKIRPDNMEVTPLTIDSSDLHIQYAVKNNELYLEEHTAEQLRNEKKKLRIYFESLKQMYCNPNLRDRFIDANKALLTTEQESIKEMISAKEVEYDENDEILNKYKKNLFFCSASFLTGTALLAVMYKQFVDFLHFSHADPDFTFTFKPFQVWIVIYTVLAIVSCFFLKKSFVKSFLMSLWGVVGVLTAKAICRLVGYFAGSGTLVSYFEPTEFFHKIDGCQFLWLLGVLAAAMIITYRKGHIVWRDWRDERDRINDEIDRLHNEINVKEKEKRYLKLKTFSAWTLITKLQGLYTEFYSNYANLISLINNFRVWYKELKTKEDNLSLCTVFPETSLLSAELLDEFFDRSLKNDPAFCVDLCANISQYNITSESFSKYKENLLRQVIDNLMARKEIREFDISNHIANNAFADIAMEVNRKLVAALDEQSGIFMNVKSQQRGVIVPSTAVFAPSLGKYRDTIRKKLGKYSEPYYESADKYCLTFLKTATAWFQECVNFK